MWKRYWPWVQLDHRARSCNNPAISKPGRGVALNCRGQVRPNLLNAANSSVLGAAEKESFDEQMVRRCLAMVARTAEQRNFPVPAVSMQFRLSGLPTVTRQGPACAGFG